MQARRHEIADRYVEALSALPGLGFQRSCDDPSDRHSWCMFAVTLDPEIGVERDGFIDAMRDRNIGTSVHYIPTHLFTAYRDLPRCELPNTEVLGARIVSLPLYPTMTDRDVDDVVAAVHAIYSERLKPVPS